MKNSRLILCYFGCFLLGVLFAVAAAPTVTFVKELLFGFEIQSMASFPYHHSARLYTRPGLGDQTFSLEVDGKIVWVSGDAAPGDLDEKLIWDAAGRVVTLELSGKPIVIYDALTKETIYKRY